MQILICKEDRLWKNTNEYGGMIYGLCIGIGAGTALEVVFNHTILGLTMGLGVGMFVGSLLANEYDEDIE